MSDLTQTDAEAILQSYHMNALILEPWFNGLYACLALMTFWTLVSKANFSTQNLVWLAIVVVMFTSATVHSALSWGYLISAFQNHGAGPYVAIALEITTVWYKAIGDVAFCLNILLADLVFIWRAWVVWQYNWYIIVIPVLATIAGQVTTIISIIGQVAIVKDATTTVGAHFAEFSTPYFGLSLATSLLTTGLIVFRIIQVQRAANKFGFGSEGGFGSYAKIIEILIESAALYSVNLVVFVALLAQRDSRVIYPELIHPQVAGMATTLIIFRVALGHARPNNQWSTKARQTTPTIVFGTNSHTNPDLESMRMQTTTGTSLHIASQLGQSVSTKFGDMKCEDIQESDNSLAWRSD